jgi:hypothetical protein
MVDVLKSDDVILTEISARLHLNKKRRDLPRI